jgi:cation/acetate symporter
MLQKLDETVQGLGFTSYLSSTKTNFDIFCITAALMFGTAGLPHVIIRFFTVPRASDARLSAGWALVFIALLYTVAPAVGAFARHNIIESVNETTYVPAAEYAEGSQLVSEAGETPSPAWFANWETTGLVAFDDKNGDGQMQIRGPAAPDGLENEVTINNDIYVLANPEIAQLPEWVIGLVVAGGLAAALLIHFRRIGRHEGGHRIRAHQPVPHQGQQRGDDQRGPGAPGAQQQRGHEVHGGLAPAGPLHDQYSAATLN